MSQPYKNTRGVLFCSLLVYLFMGCTMALQAFASEEPKDSALGIIIDILKSEDEAMHPAAISMVKEMPGEQVTKALADELANLPSVSQVQLLAALADRGDKAALPAVVTAAGAENESVRLAALKALGRLGDASSVTFLAQVAASSTGQQQKTARESLYRLRGSEVDEAILAGIPKAEAGVKIELIRSVGERNISAGVKTLLETAQDSDGKVRLESFKVLKEVAGAEYLPKLIELLIKLQSDLERGEAEKTVAAVANKVGDKSRRAEAVLAKLPSVKEVAGRCSLLSVLGKIGDDNSIKVLREALKDEDADIQDAAIRALSEWPSSLPLTDLQDVAENSDNNVHRILALRGFIRLIGLDDGRPTEETVKLYKQAMTLAPDAALKRQVLSGLADVKSLDAMQMAAEYLEDAELQQEAELSVVKIAAFIRRSHAQEVNAVLQKIVQNTKSDLVREGAQRILKKVD
jgi:HEAT repeat protein